MVENNGEYQDGIPPDYRLAWEHRHQFFMLFSRVDQSAKDDPINGVRTWNTWIDYDQFNVLASKYCSYEYDNENENDEDKTATMTTTRTRTEVFRFAVECYISPTPQWGKFVSKEEGFYPFNKLHQKKDKNPKYMKFDMGGIPTHDRYVIPLNHFYTL